MKNIIIIIIAVFLLSFKQGENTCKDNTGRETYFVFKKYTGFYIKINEFGNYHYFEYWQKGDNVTIVFKNEKGYYSGTHEYTKVDNKLIEKYNDHTLIFNDE